MKTLAKLRTYGDDCTDVGWEYTLRADGSIRAQRSSCWQGSRSGQVHISPVGTVDVGAIGDDDETDALAALTAATQDAQPDEWRQVRRGYVIR